MRDITKGFNGVGCGFSDEAIKWKRECADLEKEKIDLKKWEKKEKVKKQRNVDVCEKICRRDICVITILVIIVLLVQR